ncbi:MAG TPA: MarR family transcriptional regulator [Phycisphaerae bacterium]|nr:MarR family transcriptional regulator [Phycisphaerae bacterium]
MGFIYGSSDTPTCRTALAFIVANDGCTSAALAAHLGLTYDTACAAMRRLRASGLLEPLARVRLPGVHGLVSQPLHATPAGLMRAAEHAEPDFPAPTKSRVAYEKRAAFYEGVIMATLDKYGSADRDTLTHKGGVPAGALRRHLTDLEARGLVVSEKRHPVRVYKRATP